MSFHEVQFPPRISRGAAGGPGFKTTVVVTSGGFEQRNIDWQNARGRWEVGQNIKSPADFGEVLAFFFARHGRAHGFRFKDWLDFKSTTDMQVEALPTDQAIGAGDGVVTDFQLTKTYDSGGFAYSREIGKPVAGSVRVALDGIEQGTGWSVDTTTGIVSFTVAPAATVVVTAGFEFDVPARFDTDEMQARWDTVNTRSWPAIPVVEIRI